MGNVMRAVSGRESVGYLCSVTLLYQDSAQHRVWHTLYGVAYFRAGTQGRPCLLVCLGCTKVFFFFSSGQDALLPAFRATHFCPVVQADPLSLIYLFGTCRRIGNKYSVSDRPRYDLRSPSGSDLHYNIRCKSKMCNKSENNVLQ